MWKLKELRLTNFMSHKDSVLNMPSNDAHMIIGINNDDDGQESNGSGKSVCNEAVALALTGSALRKVKDCDLIHYGEDEAQVTQTLENKSQDKTMAITRTLFAKKSKSSTLYVEVNGVEVTTFPTVKDGNLWILDQIGVSREDLLNYYLVSEKSSSFFTASDTIKKQIVARFSNTDILIPIKEKVVNDTKSLVQVREALDLQLVKLQERCDVYREQLTNASNQDAERIKQGRIDMIQRSIDDYAKKVKENEDSIIAHEKQMPIHNQEMDLLKKELSQVPEPADHSADIKEIEDVLSQAQNEAEVSILAIKEARSNLRDVEGFKSDAEAKIKSSIQCPKCDHSFILRDKNFNIHETRESLFEMDSLINSFENEIQDHDTKRVESEGLVDEARSSIKGLRSDMQQHEVARNKVNRKIRQLQFTIDDINDQIKRCTSIILESKNKSLEGFDSIDRVRSEKIEDPQIEINKSIKVVEVQIQDKVDEIDIAKNNIVKANEFQAIFTKFMTHLSNKAIKSIESRVNSYLESMGSNLMVQFEGYKVLSTGKIKENISIVVLRNGMPESFFDSYSKGERGRINVAGILALNDLLNSSSSPGCGLDFVCLDEAMDGIDSLGVGSVMNALNTLGQPILAVSHIEPKEPYRNTIYCTKDKGVSTI